VLQTLIMDVVNVMSEYVLLTCVHICPNILTVCGMSIFYCYTYSITGYTTSNPTSTLQMWLLA